MSFCSEAIDLTPFNTIRSWPQAQDLFQWLALFKVQSYSILGHNTPIAQMVFRYLQ